LTNLRLKFAIYEYLSSPTVLVGFVLLNILIPATLLASPIHYKNLFVSFEVEVEREKSYFKHWEKPRIVI